MTDPATTSPPTLPSGPAPFRLDRLPPRAGLGAADLDWAWRYYLGRAPTAAEAGTALAAAGGDADALRLHAFAHPAAAARAGDPRMPPNGKFHVWRGGAPKVLVLGNCQGPNIARALHSLSQRALSVAGLDVTTFTREREEFLLAAAEADVILAPSTTSAEFAELSVAALRASVRAEVVGYVPVHFAGLFPDITYLGARGQRVLSPIGDYHSRIVFRAFMQGRSQAECLQAFNAETFAEQRYFEAFDIARREWERRESRLAPDDISLRSWFFERLRDRPMLYSSNHPTEAVFTEFTKRFCTRIGLRYSRQSNYICPNTLSFGAIWPILPELAQHHGLRYGTPHVYSNNTYMMGAEEFVWRSYQLYAGYDRAILEESASSRKIPI
jgi:hypothetical protein